MNLLLVYLMLSNVYFKFYIFSFAGSLMIWGGWVIVQVWETPGLSWWCYCWHAGATDSARDDSDEDLGEQRMDLEEGWERRRWVERRGMMVMMRVGWSWWQWMEWSEEVAGDQSWPGNHEMRAEDDWRRSGDEEAVLESVEESWLETWRTGLISGGRWSWSCPASSSCSVLVLLLMRVVLLLARCLLLLLLGSDLPTYYNSSTYNASTQLILTWSSAVKVESEGWDGSCVGWSESGNHCHQVDWSHLSHLQDMNHQDQDCQVQPDLSYNIQYNENSIFTLQARGLTASCQQCHLWMVSTISLFVWDSWGWSYSVYFSNTLSMSVLAYWNN